MTIISIFCLFGLVWVIAGHIDKLSDRLTKLEQEKSNQPEKDK